MYFVHKVVKKRGQQMEEIQNTVRKLKYDEFIKKCFSIIEWNINSNLKAPYRKISSSRAMA